MRIRRVASRADRSLFLSFPESLYARDPNWVPPLRSSVRALLDVARHPFYAGGDRAELELFLAEEGRDIVGRVAAIHNHASNRFHDENAVCFGFFESVDRMDVAGGLLAAVESWAADRGAELVRGPMNPSTNYECGMLIDGFARPPVLMMTYNPPYYPPLVEGAGYRKEKDLLAYISPVLLMAAGVIAGISSRGWTGLLITFVGTVIGMSVILVLSFGIGEPVPVDPISGVIATVWFFAPIAIGYGAGRLLWRLFATREDGDTPES